MCIANEFIKVINKEFNKSVPLVDVADVFFQDPNRPSSGDLRSESNITADAAAILDKTLTMLKSGKKAGERKNRKLPKLR